MIWGGRYIKFIVGLNPTRLDSSVVRASGICPEGLGSIPSLVTFLYSNTVLEGEAVVDEMDTSVKAAHIRKKIHMDWIDHKANIAKFIPSQWAHVKDYTDMTSQDTEVDRPKRKCLTIDKFLHTYSLLQMWVGALAGKIKMKVKIERRSFNVSDCCYLIDFY